jgi:hypothetical protein
MRRLHEEINYFCKCGHVKRQHENEDYSGWCVGWKYTEGKCECAAFIVDNLRYLENLSAS